GERHAHPCASVEQRTYGQSEVLNLVGFAERCALRSQAGDAYEFRLSFEEQRKGGHSDIRLLFAISISRKTALVNRWPRIAPDRHGVRKKGGTPAIYRRESAKSVSRKPFTSAATQYR